MSIIATNISKTIGKSPAKILSSISLTINEGEFVALTGRSGSGKSTLLYILSTLDTASEGTVEIAGKSINNMSSDELCQLRNEKIGFVFQFHYLINELSALDNVLLPARKIGKHREYQEQAEQLLNQFSLGKKLHRLPRELSGGEQQRVAIARALLMKPTYLFADEPTGNLDSVNGEIVMNIFRELGPQWGTTIVMVTHDPDFAQLAQRQIHLADGKIIAGA